MTQPVPARATGTPASLLTGDNAAFADSLWRAWCRDPNSVPTEWAAAFAEMGADSSEIRSTAARSSEASTLRPRSIFNAVQTGGECAPEQALVVAQRQAAVGRLINAYRVRGHTQAQVDPLEQARPTEHPELDHQFYGLTDADLDVAVSSGGLYGVPATTTLRALIERCKKAYCGGFGVEFMNIGDVDRKRWLQERLETLQDRPALTREQQLDALRMMSDAENFERLLHNRFPGTKRFSVEGAETLVPLLHLILTQAAEKGVDEAIIGMAHRGRLNVLANILEKPVRQIVEEFQGTGLRSGNNSGDVKYHLGYSSRYQTQSGRSMLLSLAFNPSHLEAVDPVVEGRVRARQDRRKDLDRTTVLPILIHGDAAFAGQGMVAEVLNLSDLKGYRTGGTIHLIVNNQIGFTTSPQDARSTPYCTDVARMLAVPIFHVNGEDVEAVAHVARLAAEWRQTFHADAIIDMYCYRKHGHNEGDEPSFTQPLLYEKIRQKATPRAVYARRMVEQLKTITADEADRVNADSLNRLEACLTGEKPEKSPESPRTEVTQLWSQWSGASVHTPVDTRFPKAELVALLRGLNQVPNNFKAHRKVQRLLEQRLDIAEGRSPVDWAVAEQAAYGSLALAGLTVRLSGQDSGRGTFSHRHAVLTDVSTGEEYTPLSHIPGSSGSFQVFDSLLSEAAVLGFEYGYSLETPDGLVLWEAQFGDFANGAQVIIDNFIVSGEQKWQRNSGVVMLLPHGYEGQGPEHSSARLERYLQSCAEDNIIVANCSTPASLFHLLRRQGLMKVRKPLVLMSPKSLLRHPECISSLDELADGAFHAVIDEVGGLEGTQVKRVVFCTGKVYYELLAARRQRGIQDIALIRLEQLYPFPAEQIRAVLAGYPADVELVWCQEEPRNMGAWPMLDEWMSEAVGRIPRYAGRKAAAAPATGYPEKHRAEQAALIEAALGSAGR
jgi:2-oxoglutarate dehydrogenase E1 component